jgi:hypothetical protein
MTMDFVIGNGLAFEDKDVFNAIYKLNLDSKALIVDEIVKDLLGIVKKSQSGLANISDVNNGRLAMMTLKTIRENINSIAKKLV